METKEFVLPSLPKESFELMKESLKKQLKQAEESGSFIDVTGIRSIGKTTALIEFAQKNNYIVITNSFYKSKDQVVPYCKLSEFNGCKNDAKFIIDEGIDYKELKEKYKFNIVTGFYNSKLDKNKKIKLNNITFKEEVIENLKQEARQLNEKIIKVRKLSDYGTYKNLIRAYADILNLLQRYDYELFK